MTTWRGKSVLVAGGAGMIGSHMARALLDRRAGVCIVDNLSAGALRNIKDISNQVDVEIADLRDQATCLDPWTACAWTVGR